MKKHSKKLFYILTIKLVCMFYYVQGDVVVDPTAEIAGAVVDNNTQFPEFIAYINANNAEGNAEAPLDVADSFIADTNWQMVGYAVFVDNNGAAGPVYVAKKRKFVRSGDVVAQNNGHVLDYTSNMHTERQLAIVALEEALGNILPVVGSEGIVVANELGPLVNNAKVPLTNGNMPQPDIVGGTYSLTGALHIYTGDNPCQNRQDDNGHFSCIEYYNALATLFPNVDFHIYFNANNIRLNSWFINTNNNIQTANILKTVLLNQLNNIIINNAVVAQNFRIRYSMQVLDHGEWKTIDGSDKSINGAGQWTLLKAKGNMVTKINDLLCLVPGENSLTIQERETLFNAIHNHTNIANIYYHAI